MISKAYAYAKPKIEIFGSIGLAEEDVGLRTEHDFGTRLRLPGQCWGLPTSRVLIPIPELALQHLGFPEKLRGFTAAYPCTVLEIADRRAMGPTWDRGGAAPE